MIIKKDIDITLSDKKVFLIKSTMLNCGINATTEGDETLDRKLVLEFPDEFNNREEAILAIGVLIGQIIYSSLQ